MRLRGVQLAGRAATDVLRARAGRGPWFLGIGDSHARVFAEPEFRLPGVTRRAVVSVSGATAAGLTNPNSVTQAMPVFTAAVSLLDRRAVVGCLLGEVDLGFLVWLGDPEQVSARVSRSLHGYTRFLESVLAHRPGRLVVYAISPPTIESYADWQGLGRARAQVTASLDQRREWSRRYNESLADWCAGRGVEFIDYWLEVCDAAAPLGIVAPFRPPDPVDHHLAPRPLAALLASRTALVQA